MAALAVLAMAMSFGRFGGPLWWARGLPDLAATLGPRHPESAALLRGSDGRVGDGFGSVYGMISALLPGLGGFRYPGKLWAFASLAISALAAAGWDAIGDRASRRIARAGLIAAVSGLMLTFFLAPTLLGWWTRAAKVASMAGPIDPEGALFELRRGFVHSAVAMGAALVLIRAAGRGRRWAGTAAVAVLAIDLAIANGRLVLSVPQEDFERPSAALSAMTDSGAEPPLRLHRAAEWHPVGWYRSRSPDRLRTIVRWQRDTLQFGFGTTVGVRYVLATGALDPAAFTETFESWTMPVEGRSAASLGLEPGRTIRYYPRRAFDLWGARFFVLPAVAADWLDPSRGIAAFLADVEPIGPRPDGPRWQEEEDWQVLRNRSAFPRAWIVHDARIRRASSDATARQAVRRELLYRRDPFWEIPDRTEFDPREIAWIEAEDPRSLRLDLSKRPAGPTETVAIEEDRPSRVRLRVDLESPGLVVLADAFDPGWSLKIDGRPAPILRANLAMRGAAVGPGTHSLQFTYEPRTFRAGLILSALGGLVGLALALPRKGRPRWEPSPPSTTPPTSASG